MHMRHLGLGVVSMWRRERGAWRCGPRRCIRLQVVSTDTHNVKAITVPPHGLRVVVVAMLG